MLRKLARDDSKPLKNPHPNKVKNTSHNFNIGYKDFLMERQFSTKSFFHNPKTRIPTDHKVIYSNTSQISLSHDHQKVGFDTSMSKNDFAPFQFISGGKPQGERSLVDSVANGSVRDGYGYPADFKTSKSLLCRDRDHMLMAERTMPLKSKNELLKTQFDITTSKEFRNKSNYGETYLPPAEAQTLPSITFKHRSRDFNILNGVALPPRSQGTLPHHKYEYYDPAVKPLRTSYNHANVVVQAVARYDPITGRHLGR
jgi:hypothetical protein